MFYLLTNLLTYLLTYYQVAGTNPVPWTGLRVAQALCCVLHNTLRYAAVAKTTQCNYPTSRQSKSIFCRADNAWSIVGRQKSVVCHENWPTFWYDFAQPTFGKYEAVTNPGLFVPLRFPSRERKVHRENFRSRETFVPWNIRSLYLLLFVPVYELSPLSFLGSERSKNFRSYETVVP